MSRIRFLLVAVLLAALLLTLPPLAQADIVGHLTQVEGRVDLLKGGKLPAIPVKVQDGVEPQDVIRTKSLSKAQIAFIDNSTITVSPESRIAIEEYFVDPAKQKRNAVLNIFQGLAHAVVTKVFKTEEPDFVVKTHTAIMGIRGTDFGIRIHPNSTTVMNFEGLLQVGNIFPEVGQLFQRAFKIAYSFGSPNIRNSVMLKSMQGTSVGRGMPPTLPFTITRQDRQQFMNQLSSGITGQKSGQGSGSGTASGGSGSGSGSGSSTASKGSGSGTATTDSGGGTETAGGGGGGTTTVTYTTNLGGPDSGLGSTVTGASASTPSVPAVGPIGLTTGTGNTGVTLINTITIPPDPAKTTTNTTTSTTTTGTTTTPTATPQTYAFLQTTQSTWTDPAGLTSVNVTSTGWGLRTGVATSGALPLPDSYGGYFTSSGAGEQTLLQGTPFPTGTSTGVSSTTLSGIVTGVPGSTLTGSATLTGTSSFGQTINFTGTVTIDPSGVLTFTYGGDYGAATVSSSARLAAATGTIVDTPGTYFNQNINGTMSMASFKPYNVMIASSWGGGATTTSGPLSQYYTYSLRGSETSGQTYFYLPWRLDTLSGTMQGVVNPNTMQGAGTITPATQNQRFVSSLALPPSPYLFSNYTNVENTPIVTTINVNSGTGVITGEVHTTDYFNGKFTSGVYSLTQTPRETPVTPPASANYAFTQAQNYHGYGYYTPATATTLDTGGFGWGLTTGVANPSWASGALALPSPYSGTAYGLTGWFGSSDNGTWSLTSGSMPTSGYGSTLSVTQMRGTVTGILGQNLSGNMTYIGSLLDGTSFNYSGPVTLYGNGSLQFNYSGSWTGISAAGSASGTLTQYPGYHFTQSTSRSYTLTSTMGWFFKRYHGTVTMPSSNWTRSGIYDGSVDGLGGSFSLYSPHGSLPAFAAGKMSIEGVAFSPYNGAAYAYASLSLAAPYSTSIPLYGNLTAGGANFNSAGWVRPSYGTQVNVQSLSLAQTLYSFSETYQGFRLATGSAPFTLANVEGYGWGQLTSTGSNTLPSNYTGYFVAQDLGTRASFTAMTPGWAGVTGTMTGTLSGVAGSTLTGTATFTGTNSRGATLNYTGNVSLAPNGNLQFNYGGNWTAGSNSGTGSGTWTQILGTYFTEYLNGSYTQTVANSAAGSFTGTQNSGTLSGTRTMYPNGSSPTTQSISASYVSARTSQTNSFVQTSGGLGVTIQGVVVGSDWQTKWGVASVTPTITTGGNTFILQTNSGAVTIDTTGKLIGQFVDVRPNRDFNGNITSLDNTVQNLVSVTSASGQTTSSFIQAVSGNVSQNPIGTTPSTQATLTTPTPLTGTGTGTIPGNISANVALTSTAASGTYVTAGTRPMTSYIVGAVGGPPGGPQTGVASMHSFKNVGGTPRQLMHLGTATHTPAAGSNPATLTINVQGRNLPGSGVGATQTGTVTVTPR